MDGTAMMNDTKLTLTVAAEHWIPFLVLTEVNGSIATKGPLSEVLEILSTKLNFQYSIKRPPDELWGMQLLNGTWNGMLGMIHSGEVDMSMGPFMESYERYQAFDFSTPLWIDSELMFMERPKLLNDVLGFIKPLTLYVYIGILLSLLVTTVCFKSITSSEREIYHLYNHKPETLASSFLWAIRTLGQEATWWYPGNNATKILMTTWLLGTFIVIKSYQGILTAMLTFPKVEIPIDSLEQLVDQNKYPWKLEVGTMVYQYFERSTNELGRKVFERKNGTFRDCFTDCQNIANGEFVGLCDFITIKTCMNFDFRTSNKCNTYAAKHAVMEGGLILTLGFPKNSSLINEVNKWVLLMRQGGLLDKWIKDQQFNASYCLLPPSADYDSSRSIVLNMENFAGIFYCLILGHVMGFLMFILEILSKKKIFNPK